LDTEFKMFSPDLCEAWLLHDSDPILAPGAVEGFANLYRRQECGGPLFEAITTKQPPNRIPGKFVPELQGVSGDGSVAIFRVDAALTSKVPEVEPNEYQVYAAQEGQLSAICILPNGSSISAGCSAGTASVVELNTGRFHDLTHAISADGTRVFWTGAAPGRRGDRHRRQGLCRSSLRRGGR
jgi:hypothetical protein